MYIIVHSDKFYFCWQWPTNDRPDLSSDRAPHMTRTVTFNQNKYRLGLDTKTDRLTDCQSKCDSDSDWMLNTSQYIYAHTHKFEALLKSAFIMSTSAARDWEIHLAGEAVLLAMGAFSAVRRTELTQSNEAGLQYYCTDTETLVNWCTFNKCIDSRDWPLHVVI
jgi:hypothetical protein